MKNKKLNLLILILGIILILTLIINFYITYNKPVYTQKIDIKFELDDYLGMAVNKTIIDFGVVPHYMSVEKTVSLKNEFDFPVIVKVNINKELEEFIFGKTNFIIEPKESHEYSLKLFASPNGEIRQPYTGQITFNFYNQN